MPTTYSLIQTVTVGSAGAASISFTSIPQTYTDLVLKASLRSIAASIYDTLGVYLNGVQTNRTRRNLYGTGSASGSNTSTYRDMGGVNANTATANIFSNVELYFPNYTSANNKSFSSDTVSENNGTEAYAFLYAGLWSSTAAITSIILDNATSGLAYMQYSSASLYGISKS